MTEEFVGQGTNARKTILLMGGHSDLVEWVNDTLMRQGYEVYTALNCQEGLQHLGSYQLDLVILDIPIADCDNRAGRVCRPLQETSNVLLVAFAAQGREEEDTVRGLDDYGSDDCQTNLLRLEELTTGERAPLRRTAPSAPREAPVVYSDGYLTMNLVDRRVSVQGEEVRLTQRECQLLTFLVENAGRVLTYDQLLEKVWGREYLSHPDYVRIYVWRLRRKIERDPQQPQYIRTEHGIGYRFEKAH